MSFTVPAFDAIRDALLRDISNLLPGADVAPDSDYFIRATSVASAVEGLYQHQQWIVRQIFPDSADAEYLELHAAVRNLKLKRAVAAAGTAAATGVPGTELATGLTLTLADGRQYISTAPAVIGGDGKATISIIAAVAGSAGNAAAGLVGTFTSAPAGLNSNAVISEIIGGVEIETHAELLVRLLDVIRRPPAGGNKYDYRRWALEVDGVTSAYVYPLRRGLGTVDVAITSGDGLPSAETVTAAQAHIDDVRPVTSKNSIVFAPDLVPIDFTIEVALESGTTLADATTVIEAALAAQFAQLQPGQKWIRSASEAVISAVPGVEDRAVVLPADNVAAVVDGATVQWLRLGDVTVTVMA